ncbi:hypothetical protein D3C86_1333980 [compost metagenome]
MRTVDIHVAQTHVAQAVAVMERMAHGFAGDLARAVEIAVVERMLFGHRHFDRVAVDRSRGRVDEALDVVLHASLEHIERTLDVHVERRTGEILAVQQPHCGQVHHAIHAVHGVVQEINVAYVAAVRVHPAAGILQVFSDVALLAPGEIVIDDDLGDGMLQQFGHDKTADKSGSADYQNFRTL